MVTIGDDARHHISVNGKKVHYDMWPKGRMRYFDIRVDGVECCIDGTEYYAFIANKKGIATEQPITKQHKDIVNELLRIHFGIDPED